VSKILITGGTGLVGTHLTKLLLKKGHSVVYLSRKSGEKNGIRLFKWDIERGELDIEAFNGVDAVVHLAGLGIADKRWTTDYKEKIYSSRIQSTQLLVNTILKNNIPLNSFVSTSAIGIYGNNITGTADENYPTATNFLAKVCHDWEHEAFKLQTTKVVIIRVGVVLAKESGFIPEVAKPIRYFMGAPLGNGNQHISWIHIDDLCAIYAQAILDPNMHGPYNAVAPTVISNKAITQDMATKMHRPILLPPVPKFVLQLLFGELSTTLVANQAVSSKKIEHTGFTFQFTTATEALNNLL
jgi:uncharacterized protein (TIGR01777 family)